MQLNESNEALQHHAYTAEGYRHLTEIYAVLAHELPFTYADTSPGKSVMGYIRFSP